PGDMQKSRRKAESARSAAAGLAPKPRGRAPGLSGAGIISVQALNAPRAHGFQQLPVHFPDGVPSVGEHGIALHGFGTGIEQVQDLGSMIDSPAGENGEL